ncbi:MAG: VOC family protein [Actinobacteria bacterium]|nr:VOC family protein [Actinomycetota bacterium]
MGEMITGLDHLVILVEELEDAAAGYEELGFRVTPGGEHADGLTRNALVPFADGTYLELVAFVDPTDERDNVWGWRPFLETGGGLVDYCAASDDLAADARRLAEAGFGLDGPDAGGRSLPDGTEIRWKSARIRQEGRVLPFLIEDETPRRLRVPGGPFAEHPNGATGISRLLISARNLAESRRALAALAGSPETSETASLLGRHEIAIVTPDGAEDPVERRLKLSGPGPFAVEIATDAVRRGELDPKLACGARIYLG